VTAAHRAPSDIRIEPAPDLLDSEINLRDALTRVRERLMADVITLLRLDPASHHLVTVLTESTSRVTSVHHRVPVGRGLAGRVAQYGTSVRLDEVADDDMVNPVLLALGTSSICAVPVRSGQRLTGVLKIGLRPPRRFSDEDVVLAEDLAHEVSDALEGYFAADERAAAAALQRSLVPSSLPVIEGLDLAGRYVPGQGGVSGDWYDVFALPGGRVGMVMGDVAGHGLPASVVMGRLRSALRAYALECDEPAEVLTRLDAKIMHFEPGAMATAVYAVTEPPFESIRVASAGHFTPIQVSCDGVAGQVDLPVGLPLGVEAGVKRTSGSLDFQHGSALVLFTDGLIERRRVSSARGADVFGSIDNALDELCRLLQPAEADLMSSRILDSMLTLEPPSDDVALLVVRRNGTDR
jgi:sigma-B regulation protein RsbU (phosphoserine phosphatase)